MKRILTTTGAALILGGQLVLAGCASIPPPHDQMGRTESALGSADEAGAREYAPLELRDAQKKYENAKVAMDQEDYLGARRLAEEAEVDATLAEVTARSAKARKSAEEIRESIRLLREEINRASNI